MQRLSFLATLALATPAFLFAADRPAHLGHPRLFFTTDDLPRLRQLRTQGVHARIWKNLSESADWCLTLQPRTEWIAPVSPDPIYLNLYDRFYAMMHDMAVMEHLAFAWAYSGDERYLDAARAWTLASCRIWRREADGEPDPGKAYAVTRILKGLAVAYDLLYQQLSPTEREEVRSVLVDIGRKYYPYFQKPEIAGPGHDKHHGSVEAASFGVLALALLEEVPEARDWLDLIVKKHTDFLLPSALTPGGAQETGSNFWASTMQYRIFFLDALRRVTGRDLFKSHQKYMDGRMALAAVAGVQPPGYAEDQQSILFGPSYGQLDYWSPVLLYLAREYRRPIYQHLALWDQTLGAIQKTRYITSNGEQLLFEMGGYAYAWYDAGVADQIEPDVQKSFAFPEVNEAYMRASYEPGGVAVGTRRGHVVVHAGGRAVFIDPHDVHHEPQPVEKLTLSDEGKRAVIRCVGVADSGFREQQVELVRPAVVTLARKTDQDVRWWCHGQPRQAGNTLTWSDGTVLKVTRGRIISVEPQGYHDEKIVGLGKLKCVDPTPRTYPLITAKPTDGELTIIVHSLGADP